MLGLCLVAALALGAYAVSSASALEWGKCEFIGSGGNYTGPNCNKAAGEKAKPKGSGEYEWRKASEVAEKRVAEGKTANVPFSGGSEGAGGVLTSSIRICEREAKGLRTTRVGCEEAGGEEHQYGIVTVECEAETDTGEAEGKHNVAGVEVTFTGCALFGSLPCNSAGAEEGEVQTSTLKGKLGWIDKAAKEVGVMLTPASGKHGNFAKFLCGGFDEIVVGVGNKKEGAFYVIGEKYPEGCWGAKYVVGGEELLKGCPGATPSEEKHGGHNEIISPITPVNQMTPTFTQVYTIESELPFANIPDRFEGKHRSSLEAYTVQAAQENSTDWSSAGEEITAVNAPEEEGEIKA